MVDSDKIKSMIDELASDTSRSQEDTLSELEEIDSHLQPCIDALKSDLGDSFRWQN